MRKYIDLFHWGQQLESVNTIQQWHNFWDARDPVAEPLAPPQGWHCGDPITLATPDAASSLSGLFEVVNPDTGELTTIPVADHKVDNLKNSYGGGLQTHNYWDNDSEFVKPFSELVKRLAVDEQAIKSA